MSNEIKDNKQIKTTNISKTPEDIEVLRVASKILKEHKKAFEVLGNE